MTAPDRRTAAVDRVRAELAALPDLPMPPDVAARIEQSVGIPSYRREVAPIAVLTCAAACLALFLVTVPGSGSGSGSPQQAGQADTLRSVGAVTFGHDGAGAFADPVRRRECLLAAGVPEPAAPLLGGSPYDVRGTPGTLLVLGTGATGRYRLVVVDAACGRSGGRVLAETVSGR